MGIVGFKPSEGKEEEPKEKKTAPKLSNIDKEFVKMIQNLEFEEDFLEEEIVLEKLVKKELIIFHKKIRDLEKKMSKRNKLMSQCYTLRSDFPKKAIRLIDEIIVLDQGIAQERQSIYDELKKHSLPEIAKIYKDIQLSSKQIKIIRNIAGTLSTYLSAVTQSIDGSYQQLENIRMEILRLHPNLK